MNFQKSYIILTLILFTVTAFAKSIQVTNITVDSSDNHISTFSKPILKVSENKNDNGVNSIHSESANILSNLTYNFNKAKPNCNYKNYEVGAINESCQINPNGSSSVNVKIESPTNPYLFQPTLSLCYNSMSMASDLGWGWNIVGSSCITKTNKSIYFDGTTESSCIRNDSLSAFSIDGTRLIKIGSFPSYIQYESAKGQIKAKAIINNNVITYFEVKYPNGNTGYFKDYAKNRFYLSEAINSNGQHIYYNYSESGQGLLLTDIYYAHKRYHVKFNYKTTSEMTDIIFSQGEKYAYSYLLSNIDISINSNLWKKYIIDYEKRNGTNLVSHIWCKDNQGNSLPPLDFKYGNESNPRTFHLLNGQLTKYFPFENPSDIIAQKGRFQYGIASDGIVIYPNYIPNVEYYQHQTAFRHSSHYFVNQFSENQEIIIANGLEDDISFDCGKLVAGKGFNGIICADIDQTPGDEIIKFNEYLNGDKDEIDITSYIPSVYGGLMQKYTFKQSFNNKFVDAKGHSSIYPKKFYVGDFNGDGINEILLIMPSNLFDSGNLTQLYLIDLASSNVLYQGNAPFTYDLQFGKYDAGNGNTLIDPNDAAKNSDQLFIMDVDGDGKSEIVHIDKNGTNTYTFDWSTSNDIKCTKIYFDASLKKEDTYNHRVYQAHLNNDNLIDFIITPEEGKNNWKGVLSMGNGKFYTQSINFPSLYNPNKNYFLQDINLDGKSDMVEYEENEKNLKIYIINNTFQAKETITTTLDPNTLVIPTNISMNNWTSSLLSITPKGEIKKYIFEGNDFNNKLLAGYTNSFGVAKNFTYQNLYNSQYISGNNAQFPFINFKGSLLLVTNLNIKTLNKTLSDIDFQYNNAIVHKQGLGFRGYEYIYSNDKITGSFTSNQFDIFHQGNILRSENTNCSTTNKYSINMDKNKIDRSVLIETSIKNKANNLIKNEIFKYDKYLNVTSKNTDYGNGYSMTDKYEYTSFDNDNNYILGQLSKEIHETNRNGSLERLSTTYTYTNNLVKEKRSFINGNLTNTEEYIYNSDGQNIGVTINSFDSPIKHSTTFSINEKGLIINKTGHDGLTQFFKYDNLDRMISSSNDKGSANYTYNGWGNLISTNKSDNTKVAEHSLWSDGEAGSIFKVERSETGKPNSISYYDEQGQVVREGSCHYDGKYLFVDKEYDMQGHIISSSQPFKHNSLPQKNIFQYDKYGRLSSIDDYKGNHKSYTYDGLNITIEENGRKTTNTYNVFNDLLSVNSYKGTVSYQHDGGGRITAETTEDITHFLKYDQYGRLTNKINVHSGTKSYHYDKEGYISEENDGENSIFYSYDAIGRITSKKVDETQTFIYNYNLYGEIESITSDDGKIIKSYKYDDNHHLKSITEKIMDKEFCQSFTYSNGHISSINYKSNMGLDATEHYIYKNEILTEIRLNDNIVIWHLDAEDEQGKAKVFTSLGNETNYTYDELNNLSSIGVSKKGKLLWKENYQFDKATNNLLFRSNHHGLTENFKYDDVDRIINVNDFHISYDKKGNITEKDNVGRYSYNPNRPYELSNITTSEEKSLLENNQKIKYNSTLQPLQIDNDSIMSEFIYGEDGERKVMKTYETNGINEKNKYYFGNKYEIVDASDGIIERLFLAGDAYNSPAVLVISQDNAQLYQIARDYQGSIKAIFDSTGNLVEELSFDPWGRMQDPQTGLIYSSKGMSTLFTERGYTGHEHLVDYQLINMNGRLYNPILGRFLSPDPILSDYTNPQNYNCYAYAINNPLKYVDKNGKDPLIIIGAAIVGIYLGGSIANKNFNPIKWNWNSFDTYAGMVIGGAIGTAAGYGFSTGLINIKFAFITPFITIGLSYATNEHHQDRWNFEYTTPAGGSFNSEINKAEKNASNSYNKAVTKMKYIYKTLQTDLSNLSPSDIVSSMVESSNKWIEKNIKSEDGSDLKMGWFSDTAPTPGGIAVINSSRLGKGLFQYGSLWGEAYTTTETFYSITGIISNNNLEEREKWVKIGSNVTGFAGGIALGSALGIATSYTGPASIAIGGFGYLFGNEMLSYTGGFAGGILYDTFQAYRFYKNLQEINNFSRYYQNSINY